MGMKLEGEGDGLPPHGVWRAHLVTILAFAWPNVITYFIELGIPMSSPVFVGHLNSPQLLGAAALATMFANTVGYSLGLGFAMGLDTLCSQAYGARQYKLVGLHCQRAMVMLTLLCIPIVAVWLQTETLLQLLFGIDSETAKLSQYYVKRLIPGIWPWAMFECLKRYLQCQRINWPVTVTVLIVCVLHITDCYLFVFYFGLGFSGAAWATSLSNWLCFILCVFFICVRRLYLNRKSARRYTSLEMSSPPAKRKLAGDDSSVQSNESILETTEDGEDTSDKNTWPSIFSLDIFRGWGAYIKLGLPSAIAIFLEWGSYEITSAISARLGEVPLATQSVLSIVANVWYAPAVGISVAGSVLVGNMLGANEPHRAKLYAIISIGLSFLYALINGGAGMLYRSYVGQLVTSNEDIVHLTTRMMWVMWIYTFWDAGKCIGGGILRGMGRPNIAVGATIMSCVLVMIPACILLGIKIKLALHGIWLGMSLSWCVLAVIYLAVIFRTNWTHEAKLAATRNQNALHSTNEGDGIQQLNIALSQDNISAVEEVRPHDSMTEPEFNISTHNEENPSSAHVEERNEDSDTHSLLANESVP